MMLTSVSFRSMARYDYSTLIRDEVSELLELEKEQKRARVRFIRLLKDGTAQAQQQAGQLVGLGRCQSQLLWKQYLGK